jgi:hypothetical protein
MLPEDGLNKIETCLILQGIYIIFSVLIILSVWQKRHKCLLQSPSIFTSTRGDELHLLTNSGEARAELAADKNALDSVSVTGV